MYDADPDLASRLQEARTAYEYREPPAPSAGPSASMWVSYDDVPLAVQFARTVAGIQATIAIIALIIVFFLGLSVASDLGLLGFTLLLFLVGAALVVPSALLACAVALRHLEKWVRASMITIECLVLAIGAIGVFTGYALLFVPVLLSAVTVLVCLALPSSLAAFDDAYDEGGTSWGSSDGWRPGGDRTGSAAAYASEDDVLAPQTGDVTWGELFGSWRRKRRD